ncbi:rhodanese-like domain-containing protein [Corynebacterium pygosceleis]|uniref:Rhodanese-like domain-containing protein n=1 Tax=Corynebacterium pygosceleis TaxID=2800406 RepID=A0A9Q4GM98_9CORY|nr:rhodanese-like domain-containing protein [Corynebacterium pygosceleis]MCK7638406.1 rhodanese-like domain-containing protein [Corynebacterium pygosceleis]MCK7675386.1 rhodanese-like domain-containing protein [Corynebacterium pygosceleis]MCL0121220.1 rhodanese-like domain-containing protein [Corynebacterium pygosceleis]MCX7445434.1 rhodanese-like domain-containing protein [Corynebacterium pygosceleis]MCX7469070.1 rhodanese-like domain-containing protein [Corynebacterium pygosceleis]
MDSVFPTDVPSGAQLIDVREADEFAEGHASGAVNIPMSEIVGRVDEIDRDRDLYVICLSGGRSARVCEYLGHRGVDAINVEGGTSAWRTADLPMEIPGA